MIKILLCVAAIAQHQIDTDEPPTDETVEERLELIEERLDERGKELDELGEQAARLVQLIAEREGLDLAEVASELETGDNDSAEEAEARDEEIEAEVDTAED